MATTGRGRPDNRSVRRGSSGPVQSATAATTAAITGTGDVELQAGDRRRSGQHRGHAGADERGDHRPDGDLGERGRGTGRHRGRQQRRGARRSRRGGPAGGRRERYRAEGGDQRRRRRDRWTPVPAVRAPAEQRRPDDRRQRCGTRERDGRPGVAGGSRACQQQGAHGHGDGRHDHAPARPAGLGGRCGERRQRVDGIVEHRGRRRRGRRAEPQQLPVENADLVQRGARRRRAAGRPGEPPRHRPGRVALLAEQLHEHRHQVGDRHVDRQGDVGAAAGAEHGQPAVDGRGAHGAS